MPKKATKTSKSDKLDRAVRPPPRPQVSPALNPGLKLLSKLGSIVVHADEALGAGAHQFDAIALKALLDDPEVKGWLAEMGPFLPVKRS